jgi:hypothetical protein
VSHDYVIIAFFDDAFAARQAADALRNWDQERKDIRLGGCGVIVEKNGRLKTDVGRWGGPEARIEAVIGVIAAVFSGGLGLVGGDVTGGGVGSFFHKASHLQEKDFEIIMEALHAGKGLLLTTCNSDELSDTAEQVKVLGGAVSAWELPAGTLDETAKAMVDAVVEPDAEADAEADS